MEVVAVSARNFTRRCLSLHKRVNGYKRQDTGVTLRWTNIHQLLHATATWLSSGRMCHLGYKCNFRLLYFFEGLQNSRFFHLKFSVGDANRRKREFATQESVDSHARASHSCRMCEGLSSIAFSIASLAPDFCFKDRRCREK